MDIMSNQGLFMYLRVGCKTVQREKIMTGFRGMRFVMDLIKRFTPKRESLTGNESLSDKQLEES